MRRSVVLLCVLAALLLLVTFRQDLLPRQLRPESRDAAPPHGISANAVSRDQVFDPASKRAEAAASPPMSKAATPTDRAADTWLTQAQSVLQAERSRKFGADVAALMARPPSEAWPRLTALARNGDSSAGTAATLLAIECTASREWVARGQPGKNSLLNYLGKGLSAERLALLRAIDARQGEQESARAASCAKIEGIAEFMAFATDRFMRGDDLDVQLYEASQMENDRDAIAILRDLSTSLDTDQARRELAERLLRSAEPEQQREGRDLLETLAASDADSLGFLADCFRNGCGRFAGDADVARAWLERAAGAGDWAALTQLIGDFSAAHSNAEAWAWARYRLELAQAACFNSGAISLIWLAESAREVQRLEAPLNTNQRLEAEALWRAIRDRWLSQARHFGACNP